MTPSQAGQQYGAAASEWSIQRGELYSSASRVTIKDLLAMEDDETIAAMFYAIETTLGQVTWGHTARDNGKPSTAPEALEAQAFADSLLTDMQAPFQSYVENAVSYLLPGYSLAEVLYRQRTPNEGSRFTDRLWGVKNIVEREQTTVQEWVVQDGVVVAFKQNSASGTKTVPLAKCLHLTHKGGVNKPQGKSLFKAAVRSYRMKRRIQDSEAIGIERDLCGLPVMTMPQEDIDLATNEPDTPAGKQAVARIQAAMAAVQDMRMNSAGGLVIPSDPHEDEEGKPGTIPRYDFKIVTSAGSRTIDTRSAIRDYDLMMMRIAMMQFLRLGDRAGGSYALSDTQSSLAMRAITAIVNKIAHEWGEKVLRALWLLNGMDLRWMPEMVSSNINEDSLEEVGRFLESLASAQDILAEDEELAEAMKGRLMRRTKKEPDMKPKPEAAPTRTQPVAVPEAA